jgi:hypothetical protein
MKERLEALRNIDKIGEAQEVKVDQVLVEACQKFLISIS